MKNKNEFAIHDIQVFANSARKEAANCLSISNSGKKAKNKPEIFDDFITISQCCDIIRDICQISDADAKTFGKLIINEDKYADIVLEMADQIYQSSLCKLAAEDLLECAWNSQTGSMEFWLLDDDGEEREINNSVL